MAYSKVPRGTDENHCKKAVKAHRVVRSRGSHIFQTIGSDCSKVVSLMSWGLLGILVISILIT
jgi:hypothetical protein